MLQVIISAVPHSIPISVARRITAGEDVADEIHVIIHIYRSGAIKVAPRKLRAYVDMRHSHCGRIPGGAAPGDRLALLLTWDR
jgi:hypothetical protein